MNNEEPTAEIDVAEAISALLAIVRDQDKRLNAQDARIAQQDELMLAMQKEISLLGKAVGGHQAIIEAEHPAKPLPPAPPTIVH